MYRNISLFICLSVCLSTYVLLPTCLLIYCGGNIVVSGSNKSSDGQSRLECWAWMKEILGSVYFCFHKVGQRESFLDKRLWFNSWVRTTCWWHEALGKSDQTEQIASVKALGRLSQPVQSLPSWNIRNVIYLVMYDITSC